MKKNEEWSILRDEMQKAAEEVIVIWMQKAQRSEWNVGIICIIHKKGDLVYYGTDLNHMPRDK